MLFDWKCPELLTGRTLAGVSVFVLGMASATVSARARVARDVFAFAILTGVAFAAGTSKKKKREYKKVVTGKWNTPCIFDKWSLCQNLKKYTHKRK